MRALALPGLLLVLGCTPSPPAPFRAPPPAPHAGPPAAPLVPAPAPSFAGVWRVVLVDGQVPRTGHSPILIRLGPELLHARADCANLGEPAYAIRGDVLSVEPPPKRLIGSCVRGLSDDESAFTRVFQPGAVGRLRGERLVLERAGRTVEAVREPASATAP